MGSNILRLSLNFTLEPIQSHNNKKSVARKDAYGTSIQRLT